MMESQLPLQLVQIRHGFYSWRIYLLRNSDILKELDINGIVAMRGEDIPVVDK